jgi:hypothetical protein
MKMIANRSRYRYRPAGKVARGLGWFSIGLGVAELLMPRIVARATGLRGQESLIRLYGLREIGNGIGILGARNPAPWVWGRVAGDAIDLATLGNRLRDRDANIAKTGAAIVAVAGVTALDAACARSLERRTTQSSRDYSDRSGLPQPAEQMRGAARADFETPPAFRTPEALRPYSVS